MTHLSSRGFLVQFAAASCFAGVVGALMHLEVLIAHGFLALGVILAAIGSVLVEWEDFHVGFDAPESNLNKGEETR
jgi:hypothetical protein